MRLLYLLFIAATATMQSMQLRQPMARLSRKPQLSRQPPKVTASAIPITSKIVLSITPVHHDQKAISVYDVDRRVKEIIFHPNFKSVVGGVDAALYILDEPLKSLKIPKIPSLAKNSFYVMGRDSSLSEIKIIDGDGCSKQMNENEHGISYPALDSSLACFFLQDTSLYFERGSLVIATDSMGESSVYGLVSWNFARIKGWPVGVLKMASVWEWALSMSKEFE